MKRTIFCILSSVLLLSACGPAVLSTSSGSSAKASAGAVTSSSMLSFITESGAPLEVKVDDKLHALTSVKRSHYMDNKNFRRDSRNAIVISPGSHNVLVKVNGKEVYNSSVVVATQEQKVIELGDIR